VNASKSLDILLDDMKNHPKRYVHFSVFGKKEDGGLSKKEQEDVRAILKGSK
jgi:phospholipid/cholesterol/gamma-HCH transport system substrate-binding protein